MDLAFAIVLGQPGIYGSLRILRKIELFEEIVGSGYFRDLHHVRFGLQNVHDGIVFLVVLFGHTALHCREGFEGGHVPESVGEGSQDEYDHQSQHRLHPEMTGEIRQLEVIDQSRVFPQKPSAGIEDIEYPEDVIGVVVDIHLTPRADVAHGEDGRRQLGGIQAEGPEEHQQREPEPPGAEVRQPVEHRRYGNEEHNLRDGGPLSHFDAGEVQGQDAGLYGSGGGRLCRSDGGAGRGCADGKQILAWN